MPSIGISCKSGGVTISEVGALNLSPEEQPDQSTAFGEPLREPTFGLYLRLSAIWLTLAQHRWVLLVILTMAWYLRARDPGYSSAFLDESIYILYGRMFLSRQFEAPIDQPLHFSFGWYLWPALAAAADRVHGLVGVRELAALLGTLTVLAVYGFARRLFSPAVGLASAAVFALLGPAIFAFRIATRDAGSICFLALGLWLYVRAWQEEDENHTWMAAAACFFAAFLCKYLVALFFPFLVLLTLRKGFRPVLFFSAPLTLLCGAYGFHYAGDLAALLSYARGYTSLKAPPGQAWQIYVTHRLDFWVLAGLSLLAWARSDRASHWTKILFWVGALIIPVFQWYSRSDYDYWKHVNYSLLFLTPLAMQGLLSQVRHRTRALYAWVGSGAVGLLALLLAFAGNAWSMDQFLFWPNVEPVAAFFEGRLAAENRVLVDDSVFRYYFQPPLRQRQITDPFYLRYGDAVGDPAYAAAVRDGFFDYVVLDGGIGDEARRMQAAIQPQLASHYVLRLRMPDPALGQPIEIYERDNAAPPAPSVAAPRVEIVSPRSQATVQTENKGTALQGVATGGGPGSYILAEVFTDRWYPQGGKIFPRATDGAFSGWIYLAGGNEQQCHHLVRVRLYDASGRAIATAVNFGIARANQDGSAPSCR